MSDTNVNAYRLELADKERQLTTLQGEIDSLKKTIRSIEPEEEPTKEEVKEEADKELAETAPQPEEVAKTVDEVEPPKKTGRK